MNDIVYRESPKNNQASQNIPLTFNRKYSWLEKISTNFSEYRIDNFLVTSLNGRTIFRIKFDNSFEKVTYMEPMYLGERIRDIKYIEKEKIIVLALEESGSIGVLSIAD